MRVYKNLEIKHLGRNAITFKNFSGLGTPYNAEGKRNFCIYLDDSDASYYKYDNVKYDVGQPDQLQSLIKALKTDGWYIKTWTSDPDKYEPRPYLKVNVSLRTVRPDGREIPGPKIVLEGDDGRLTEIPEEIKENFMPKFDRNIIEYMDLVINPYNYDANKQSGYLHVMYAKFVNTDPFAKDYQMDEGIQ